MVYLPFGVGERFAANGTNALISTFHNLSCKRRASDNFVSKQTLFMPNCFIASATPAPPAMALYWFLVKAVW